MRRICSTKVRRKFLTEKSSPICFQFHVYAFNIQSIGYLITRWTRALFSIFKEIVLKIDKCDIKIKLLTLWLVQH